MFGKIETKFWDSLSIRGLSDSCKLAFIYLLSNKHGNPLGYYVLPLSYMADDLEWSIDRVKKTVKELERRGLVAYDDAVRIVWVIGYLRYHTIKKNQTENSSLALLQDLPLSRLAKGLYAAVKREYPGMKICSYLESLVSDSSLFGDDAVTGQTRGGVPSISISPSKSTSKSESASNNDNDFEEFWSIFKKLRRAEAKPLTLEHWNATIAGRNGTNGHPPIPASALIMAARNYRDYVLAEGTERKYIMQSASFVGPKKRGWETYREPVKTKAQEDDAELRKWAGIEEE